MNILSNDIGAEQANALIKIMESKSNLTTLCGFSGDETELDLSKKGLTAGCAVLVANEIKNNGALTILDISNNNLSGVQLGDLSGKCFCYVAAYNHAKTAVVLCCLYALYRGYCPC